jgi:hypothetical protein
LIVVDIFICQLAHKANPSHHQIINHQVARPRSRSSRKSIGFIFLCEILAPSFRSSQSPVNNHALLTFFSRRRKQQLQWTRKATKREGKEVW